MRPCPVATVQFHQPSQCDVQLGRQPQAASGVLSVMCAPPLHAGVPRRHVHLGRRVADGAVTFTGGA